MDSGALQYYDRNYRSPASYASENEHFQICEILDKLTIHAPPDIMI
jgi:hypothetical protein